MSDWRKADWNLFWFLWLIGILMTVGGIYLVWH